MEDVSINFGKKMAGTFWVKKENALKNNTKATFTLFLRNGEKYCKSVGKINYEMHV